MPTLGFHVSHEQLSPARALAAVRAAEAAGFRAAMCSDHSGAVGRATGRVGLRLVVARRGDAGDVGPVRRRDRPGQRYHPALVAQSIATLGDLFPGRFWAALGSGEALNEHVTGDRWPDKTTRTRGSSSAWT